MSICATGGREVAVFWAAEVCRVSDCWWLPLDQAARKDDLPINVVFGSTRAWTFHEIAEERGDSYPFRAGSRRVRCATRTSPERMRRAATSAFEAMGCSS